MDLHARQISVRIPVIWGGLPWAEGGLPWAEGGLPWAEGGLLLKDQRPKYNF